MKNIINGICMCFIGAFTFIGVICVVLLMWFKAGIIKFDVNHIDLQGNYGVKVCINETEVYEIEDIGVIDLKSIIGL